MFRFKNFCPQQTAHLSWLVLLLTSQHSIIPNYFHYHCIVHQQVVYIKVPYYKHVMNVVEIRDTTDLETDIIDFRSDLQLERHLRKLIDETK